jgi:hypothetical protein
MKTTTRDEAGVALLTVLLFMALVVILITTMLTVAGNETIISGLHRDGARAKEVAEAGLEEGLQRIALGHYFALNSAAECYDTDPSNDRFFANSLDPANAQVRVCLQEAGSGGAILELQSNARVGVARRRLSMIALQKVSQGLPNILYGHDCASGGSALIASGDVYCQTYLKLKTAITPPWLAYAGWRVSKLSPGAIPPCHTRAECVQAAQADGHNCAVDPASDPRCMWYAGHRRAVYRGQPFRPSPLPDNATLDTRRFVDGAGDLATGQVNFVCSAPGPAPAPWATVTVQSAGIGWVVGDKRNGAIPPADTMDGTTPLYGCDTDLRPYTWVREAFDSDDDPDSNPDKFVWFKTIEYEDWFNDYWVFCQGQAGDPAECTAADVLTWVKNAQLQANPMLGAVPPFPNFDALDDNYHQRVTGGGTLTGADPISWGTCVEGSDGIVNNCDGAASDPRILLLTGGDYRINANIQAHGTILVGPNADLEVNGTFTCWCVLVIDGNLTLGNGTVTIYGGLVAKNTAELSGNITVYAGSSVSNIPVGLADVNAITWWQR